MVNVETITQTSNRKLATLFNSPVSSSLRIEVLITNLLGSIERGELSDSDLRRKGTPNEGAIEDAEFEENVAWRSAASTRLKRKAKALEETQVQYQDEEEKEEDGGDDDDDVPSPAFEGEEQCADDPRGLVPASSKPSSSPKSLSRKLTVPLPDSEEDTLLADEPPSPTGNPLGKHPHRSPPKKRLDYRAQLEDIEIEVIDEGNSSDEHDHLPDPSKALSEYIKADEGSGRCPLVIRIKMPTQLGESGEASLQLKRKRIDQDSFDGGHDDDGLTLDLEEERGFEHPFSSPSTATEIEAKRLIAHSPKKKLRLLCEDRETSRTQ